MDETPAQASAPPNVPVLDGRAYRRAASASFSRRLRLSETRLAKSLKTYALLAFAVLAKSSVDAEG